MSTVRVCLNRVADTGAGIEPYPDSTFYKQCIRIRNPYYRYREYRTDIRSNAKAGFRISGNGCGDNKFNSDRIPDIRPDPGYQAEYTLLWLAPFQWLTLSCLCLCIVSLKIRF